MNTIIKYKKTGKSYVLIGIKPIHGTNKIRIMGREVSNWDDGIVFVSTQDYFEKNFEYIKEAENYKFKRRHDNAKDIKFFRRSKKKIKRKMGNA